MKIIAKKRRLEGKTNYTKRRRILENSKERIVIRKTNRYILIQEIESKEAQDSIKSYTLSKELLSHGWPADKSGSLKNLAASYLTGLLAGSKIKKEGKNKLILDSGLIRSTKESKIYAAVKGIIDAGIDLPCSKEVFPKEERIKTEKMKDIFEKVKNNILKGAN